MTSTSTALARSSESSAAFAATQLVRQFTLKNTVAQVSQGMQGYVGEVNGQMRSSAMGPTLPGFPTDMGTVPASTNLPQRDGAGRPLGYCAWDNSSATSNANYLAGQGVASPLVYAVISPGLNGAIETTCADILTTRRGLGDDYVQVTAPSQTSSRQFRSAVGTEAELLAMPGENGDVRLVAENNRLYSYLNGAWSAIGAGSGTFTDDSASNGAGAISYTSGKVTVGDFQASTVTVTGTLSATTLLGNGAGLTDLNAGNITSGTLSVARGGTGVTATPTNGQLLIGNGTGYTLGTITAGSGVSVLTGPGSLTIANTGVTSVAGTANQVIVSGGTGAVTLSLPQAIATTSSPTFGGLALNGALSGTTANFTGAVNLTGLSVAGVPATVAFQYSNSTGEPSYPNNLAMGLGALAGEKRGGNVAIGERSLASLTPSATPSDGVYNTALGYEALYLNQTGSANIAVGQFALGNNTTGSNNVALGQSAMSNATTARYSTGLGQGANLTSGALNYATAVGASSRVATHNTLVLGSLAASKNASVSTVDDQVVIGATGRNDTYSNTRLFVSGVVNITEKLFVNGIEINKNGTTNATDINSGLLAPAYGGTGVNGSAAANGRLLIGNGSGYTLANITGTANQVNVSNGAGSITLSLPQSISSSSTPTFAGSTLTSNLVMFPTYASAPALISLGGADSGFAGDGRYHGIRMWAAGDDQMAIYVAGSSGRTTTGAAPQSLGPVSTLATRFRQSVNPGYGFIFENSNNAALVSISSVSGDLTSVGNLIAKRLLIGDSTGGVVQANIAVGPGALSEAQSGLGGNTAIGFNALAFNTSGSFNVALGSDATVTTGALTFASAIGARSSVSTSNTLVLARPSTDQVVIGATGRNDTQLNTRLYVNGAVNIADRLFVNGVEVTGGGTTDASNINSGMLATNFGGTGVNGSAASNGQLLIGNGSGYTLANITGTANQVNVSNGAGSITLSLPQNIATTSTPTFGGLTLNGSVTGTTANFSGRVDVGSLYVGGEQLQAMTKTNIDAALTYASDTGNPSYNQPNLALGGGALSANKRAGNVAIGASVLGSLSAAADGMMGTDNTGLGYRVLPSVNTGFRNTAIGSRAAHAMTSGYANTVVGRSAGFSINTGFENTAIGENALFNGVSAYQNVAIGKSSMFGAGTGYDNTAVGNNTMFSTTSGYGNVAVGRSALHVNNTGSRNVGLGMESLRSNVNGSYNLGIGYRADVSSADLSYAQAVGNMALVSSSNTLVLGAQGVNKFGSSVDDQVVIGSSSRNDTHADTRLYVNGAINASGRLYAGSGEFTGRVNIASGLANALHFGDNGENLDTTSIYRFNEASDQTRLRVRLSDNSQGFGTAFSDEFQIGYENGGYTPTFRVAGSGAVISSSSITATAFNTSSDRRLKNNLQVQDADTLLKKLSALSAYSYDYAGQHDLGRRIGVIAQDVLPLFPEAVTVRPDGFYAVDYGALGALAAAGVGHLNQRVNDMDKTFQDHAKTVERVTALENTTTDHAQRLTGLEGWRSQASQQITAVESRLDTLDAWKTRAAEEIDSMQLAIESNSKEIAKNALAIAGQGKKIEDLEVVTSRLGERLDLTEQGLSKLKSRVDAAFTVSQDGSTITLGAPNLVVGNFTAQQARMQYAYTQRLEAEMARIKALEVDNLLANNAVARRVQAEELNTGSAQVYAGAGLPAVLFSARADGHYTLSTSALDGSYATATVIVNAGQAKIIPSASEGIELFAEGNTIKAIAAGKSIKASWIKTG
ncbi:tail fiber domain-containing protein [Limnobacter sp.]|uniref:tail fiber domain-containing protein n=1 Tax=Limnobacter sp. TaxID=2003368 RepID=UPI0035198E24